MRTDKNLAFELRKTGKSYNEIKAILGVPKATLSDWFQFDRGSILVKETLNKEILRTSVIRLRDLHKVRGAHLARLYSEAVVEAVEEFERLKHHPLFISALMVYWGEGSKTTPQVKICNTDPKMMRVFLKFLIEICRIPQAKIKAHLIIYPDLDHETCVSYWAKELELPVENFYKSTVIIGRHQTRRLEYGVCNLSVCSRYLKEKMIIWLELLPNALLNNSYYSRV